MCYTCAERNKLRRVFSTAIDLVKAGAECPKLRQPMRAIFALSRVLLLRDHVSVMRPNIKRRQGVTSHCPISKILGPFNSAHRALQVEACAPKMFKKGAP